MNVPYRDLPTRGCKPVKRSSADGRVGQDYRFTTGETSFTAFAAGAAGARYGGNLEEWRWVFSYHLQRFSGICPDGETLIRYLAEFLRGDGLPFDRQPTLSGTHASAYRLPFDLLLVLPKCGRNTIRAPLDLILYGRISGGQERTIPPRLSFGQHAPYIEPDSGAWNLFIEVEASNLSRRKRITDAAPRGELELTIVDDPRDDERKAEGLEQMLNGRSLFGTPLH